MTAFLMSLNMRCWRAIVAGWEHPTENDATGKVTRKFELKWTREEDDAAVGHSRALNALFNVINQNIFKLINTCKSAKEAWDIQEVAYEGTSKVKMSYVLGKKMSDAKLVRKVLRSFPPWFNMKITAIEEANDVSKMKLDELFGSLQTFELHLRECIRCHECEEFGHIQFECPAYLKHKKKSLVVTLSDEKDYLESDEEEVRKALISISSTKEGAVESVNHQMPEQQGLMSNEPISESTLKRKWEEDQVTIVH
ncbi:gag-pol polyprotein [Cucumis melo var. makuwa]|uniref:Gag-pol polyprotein n=1 Tax=Cucumis melo var. makuwa TaxID=1194695 RepID=A0A5A7TTW6_CUCMM|nr:gag-pol polyprotein [Cucumis melo var. makuwa]